ncbi:hypothetical protein A0H81_09097 [Grifola frondosa]|uniref:Uncharacterized protein n=1 Tax=Grifola frondosa TaxID=5627 RepID=A0A1C7M6E4_GRIFR|nr:hypothetical protein A0H81_09097 [Grifola frondosa]
MVNGGENHADKHPDGTASEGRRLGRRSSSVDRGEAEGDGRAGGGSVADIEDVSEETEQDAAVVEIEEELGSEVAEPLDV